MSIAETLAAFARADAAAARAVLHNCRTAGFGTEAYGPAASLTLFRAAPLALDPASAVVAADLVALFGQDADGNDAALFADVHDGHAMRLWALARPRVPAPPVDESGVPADLDLHQAGGRFLIEPADHPALAASAIEPLRSLGNAWIDEQPPAIVGPLERARPFLLRAASAGVRTAALILLQGYAGDGGIARCAVGVLLDGEARVVVDDAGRAASAARRRIVNLRPAEPMLEASTVAD